MNRALLAAITGGAIGGALDIIYANVVFGPRGVSPMRIFHSIASGLLGRDAYDGGIPVAVLGGLLHFGIAIAMALAFVTVARSVPRLLRAAVTSGLLYGALLFFLMNFVVVPLSAAPFPPPAGWYLAGSLFAHTVLVGTPIALAARRFLG